MDLKKIHGSPFVSGGKKKGVAFPLRGLTHETLYRRIGFIESHCALYRRMVMAIILLAVSTPFWFGMAVVMGIAGQTLLATGFVLMMPGALLAAGLAWLCLRLAFFPRLLRHLKQLEQIRQELRRRGRGQFSFISDN
jgi:hypothetical protein